MIPYIILYLRAILAWILWALIIPLLALILISPFAMAPFMGRKRAHFIGRRACRDVDDAITWIYGP